MVPIVSLLKLIIHIRGTVLYLRLSKALVYKSSIHLLWHPSGWLLFIGTRAIHFPRSLPSAPLATPLLCRIYAVSVPYRCRIPSVSYRYGTKAGQTRVKGHIDTESMKGISTSFRHLPTIAFIRRRICFSEIKQ